MKMTHDHEKRISELEKKLDFWKNQLVIVKKECFENTDREINKYAGEIRNAKQDIHELKEVLREHYRQKLEKGEWAIRCINEPEEEKQKDMTDYIRDDIKFYKKQLEKLDVGSASARESLDRQTEKKCPICQTKLSLETELECPYCKCEIILGEIEDLGGEKMCSAAHTEIPSLTQEDIDRFVKPFEDSGGEKVRSAAHTEVLIPDETMYGSVYEEGKSKTKELTDSKPPEHDYEYEETKRLFEDSLISEFVKKLESIIHRMPNGKIEYIGHLEMDDILKEYKEKLK